MKRKNILLLLIAAIIFAMPGYATDNKKNIDRKEWFKELRQYKHNFLTKELDLTKEQEAKFFPMYDEMDDAMFKINREARAMEKKITKSSEKVSDLEYEKAAEAMYEVKGKEAAIEKQYFTKFKTVLTPKQLFELKQAERRFTDKLMKEHSKARSGKK
ncbi:MAG: Spy/CpxP family protein refolding chaperone [Muribaculum sp.]|nr:Spy/CpxP family protein refolding chaperone [Muribaculum sp.]